MSLLRKTFDDGNIIDPNEAIALASRLMVFKVIQLPYRRRQHIPTYTYFIFVWSALDDQ